MAGTTEVYCLTIWRLGVQNWSVGRALLLWRLREGCSMSRSSLLVGHYSVTVLVYGLIMAIFIWFFSYVCLCSNFPFFTRTLATGLGAILLHYDLVLTCSHLQTPYFQLRRYSQVPGGHEFRGNLSCQYIPFSVKLTKLNIKNPTYVSSQHSY